MALLNMVTSLPPGAECWDGCKGLRELWYAIFQVLVPIAGKLTDESV